MSQCVRVCPSVGGCVPEWEDVSDCASVGGCARVYLICACVCEVWVSLSYILMTDTQVHLCVCLITGCFGHVAKTSRSIRQLSQHSNVLLQYHIQL